MARVVEGFHSFTCTTTRLSMNGTEPYLPLPSQSKLVLIYRPRRMEGRDALGITMTSKQSAHDRYATIS